LIYDSKILFETLGSSLSQMRAGGEQFVLFPVGQDYACVARSGRTAKAAILLRVVKQKIEAVRLVICPVLLHKLQILMNVNSGADAQPESSCHGN
jgi:hypothetical protein